MNFIDFRNKFQNTPIINSIDVVKSESSQNIYNQLVEWTKKGLLIQLKRGLYILNVNDRKIELNDYFIANQIYQPSYVSLEYALSFYELIPETVATITSVTTKKTQTFENSLGMFSYRHVKQTAFRGFYKTSNKNGLSYYIADPEKSIADFLYFNLSKFQKNDTEIFENSYRFQNFNILNRKKIKFYSKLFGSKKLIAVANNLCKIIKR